MTLDRLQAAWPYLRTEVLRPMFRQFEGEHEDLAVAVVRTLLVRPAGMRRILQPQGTYDTLDQLLADRDTFIDSATDARNALARIKPDYFLNGRAVGHFLSELPDALAEYENPALSAYYLERLERFVEKHMLPYRLDKNPLKLTPLLPAELDRTYRALKEKVMVNDGLREALEAFEDAWDQQSADWTQINAKEAVRRASLLAENALVLASQGHSNEFTHALIRMRNHNRFPSNDFANIFDRAYTFVNNYPNIRHPGNPACVKRDLRKEDALLSALVFVGLSACADELCEVGA
jgi:hypothetical protein